MGRTPPKAKNRNADPSRYDTPRNHLAGGPGGIVPPIEQTPLFAASGEFLNNFIFLAARDDGWLRMVPHDAGRTVYYKWKFTGGRWSNHYVMYMDTSFNPAEAIAGLLKKLAKVDAGELRPVPDSYHQ